LKSDPRNFLIVRTFAGDSTIKSFVADEFFEGEEPAFFPAAEFFRGVFALALGVLFDFFRSVFWAIFLS